MFTRGYPLVLRGLTHGFFLPISTRSLTMISMRLRYDHLRSPLTQPAFKRWSWSAIRDETWRKIQLRSILWLCDYCLTSILMYRIVKAIRGLSWIIIIRPYEHLWTSNMKGQQAFQHCSFDFGTHPPPKKNCMCILFCQVFCDLMSKGILGAWHCGIFSVSWRNRIETEMILVNEKGGFSRGHPQPWAVACLVEKCFNISWVGNSHGDERWNMMKGRKVQYPLVI